MWLTTGRNDRAVHHQAVTSGQLSHQTHLQDANLANCRLCSCIKDFNPQLKPVPIYRPQRDERLGLPEHMQANILLKDVMHWCVVPSSGGEPITPNLESDVLTTRPTISWQGFMRLLTYWIYVECGMEYWYAFWQALECVRALHWKWPRVWHE